MKNSYGHYPKKGILSLDLIAVICAFFASLLIRYRERFFTWPDIFDGLYITLIISVCLIQIVVFLTIDVRRKSVYEMDVIENVAAVIRDRTVITVLMILYLYATQRGELSSRLVLALIYILNIVFDLAFRLMARKRYLSLHPPVMGSEAVRITYPYPSKEELRTLMEKQNVEAVVVYRGDSDAESFSNEIDELYAEGFRVYAGLEIPGYRVRSGIARDTDGYTSIPTDIRRDRYSVFGVNYAIARCEEAVLHVIRHIKELSGGYICFSNTHTLVMAREDRDYREVLNNAEITFADGNPIAQLQIAAGLSGVERVAGPDFMEHMFRDTADGKISHYFYGSSPETLEALDRSLREKYPGLDIRGMYSPPYRELTDEEDEEDIRRINDSGADLIWIGLGAPKQEKWMANHRGRINGLMLGVGAGFDFHAGTVHRAPLWMRKIGMEWLYRLCQNPGRLFKRYFVTNSKFYIYRITERFGSGKRG